MTAVLIREYGKPGVNHITSFKQRLASMPA